MKKRIRPEICIVCHRATIYPDAAQNHPYGACWEHQCFQCGCDQIEDAWFAQLYGMPPETSLTLQCPFTCYGRCTTMHTFPLGDLLKHTPAVAQFRCSGCDTWGTGFELLLCNKKALKQTVDEIVEPVEG